MNQGDRIFALAQLWKENQEYRQFISDQKKLGKWIIMDNGAGDFSITTTQDDLIKIIQDLEPSEIIPIDILYNKEATIYNLDRFVEMMKANNLLDKAKIFAVPQGKDKQEWFECYEYMLNHPYVSTIGLSKITIPYIYKTGSKDAGIMEARHLCYEELKSLDLIKKPIHCLGAGDPREFLKYINDPLMRSTDSCFSVWSAMNNISWNDGNFERITTPLDYFDRDVTEEQAILAVSNVDFLKKVLNTGR
jgi:hypothetical protein